MKNQSYGLNQLGHLTWKSYNSIKKKAMEQEFSTSGLVLSLSIAFFIVISAANILNFAYLSIEPPKSNIESKRIYLLEIEKNSSQSKSDYYIC